MIIMKLFSVVFKLLIYFFKTSIEFLVESRIYISLAALLLTIKTQIICGMGAGLYSFSIVIFLATIIVYNQNLILSKILGSKPEKIIYKKLIYSILITAFASILILFMLLPIKVSIFYLMLFLPVFFYQLPYGKYQNQKLSLRTIPYFKIFLISAVWSAITVLPVMLNFDIKISIIDTALIFIARFLFIFSITIPFDIRDKDIDRQNGLKTLPQVLGNIQLKVLSIILLLLSLILTCLFAFNSGRIIIIWFELIVAIITGIALLMKESKKVPYYHNLIFDGTLLLNGLSTLIYHYFIKW